MKFSIEFNSVELKNCINSGVLLALAEATAETDVDALVAKKIINHETKLTNSTSEKTPEQVPEKAEMPPAQNPVLQEDKKKDEPQPQINAPSVVELRAKAQEKGGTAEGKKAIKALLDKYESKSISTIPEEKRAAFMAELEAI